MNKTKLPKKIESCGCDCNSEKPSDPSRRDFMKQATTLTMIGSTAFILQACGGGGSPTGPEDPDGGDAGGGNEEITYSYSTLRGTDNRSPYFNIRTPEIDQQINH